MPKYRHGQLVLECAQTYGNVKSLPTSVNKAAEQTFFSQTAESSMATGSRDRKSTRLNSSHSQISYAVFCLKKKKDKTTDTLIVERTIKATHQFRARDEVLTH